MLAVLQLALIGEHETEVVLRISDGVRNADALCVDDSILQRRLGVHVIAELCRRISDVAPRMASMTKVSAPIEALRRVPQLLQELAEIAPEEGLPGSGIRDMSRDSPVIAGQ